MHYFSLSTIDAKRLPKIANRSGSFIKTVWVIHLDFTVLWVVPFWRALFASFTRDDTVATTEIALAVIRPFFNLSTFFSIHGILVCSRHPGFFRTWAWTSCTGWVTLNSNGIGRPMVFSIVPATLINDVSTFWGLRMLARPFSKHNLRKNRDEVDLDLSKQRQNQIPNES